MKLHVNYPDGGYDIIVARGALKSAGEIFDLGRKVLIVTDEGVPKEYAETVASACANVEILTVPQGEQSKSMETLELVLGRMLKLSFGRGDCVVAVGGGVPGDLAGFAASVYMRGVDYYSVPTTLLSQVDSSIGGKTAVNFGGIKNIIGSFYRPRGVLIDPDVLRTLDERQFAAGMAEVVKMALTFDRALFEFIERADARAKIDEIIPRALAIKKQVVEKDEREAGLRRALNFGHTIGHGIEAAAKGKLLHGECVALGMLPMCSVEVRARLLPVLKKLGLPTDLTVDANAVYEALLHDKKGDGESVYIVRVEQIGSYIIEKVPFEALKNEVIK